MLVHRAVRGSFADRQFFPHLFFLIAPKRALTIQLFLYFILGCIGREKKHTPWRARPQKVPDSIRPLPSPLPWPFHPLFDTYTFLRRLHSCGAHISTALARTTVVSHCSEEKKKTGAQRYATIPFLFGGRPCNPPPPTP